VNGRGNSSLWDHPGAGGGWGVLGKEMPSMVDWGICMYAVSKIVTSRAGKEKQRKCRRRDHRPRGRKASQRDQGSSASTSLGRSEKFKWKKNGKEKRVRLAESFRKVNLPGKRE